MKYIFKIITCRGATIARRHAAAPRDLAPPRPLFVPEASPSSEAREECCLINSLFLARWHAKAARCSLAAARAHPRRASRCSDRGIDGAQQPELPAQWCSELVEENASTVAELLLLRCVAGGDVNTFVHAQLITSARGRVCLLQCRRVHLLPAHDASSSARSAESVCSVTWIT
jgi:hypothetical protein